MIDLTALAIVCTPTPTPGPSSSELMARHILNELEENDVSTTPARTSPLPKRSSPANQVRPSRQSAACCITGGQC